MNDFETHPKGTHAEIVASRQLAKEIEQVMEQFGQVIPASVLLAYGELKQIYIKQLEGYYE